MQTKDTDLLAPKDPKYLLLTFLYFLMVHRFLLLSST